MPSSTSSSEAALPAAFVPVRLTAADRPGVAQPVPVRDIPVQPWRSILIGAVAMCALLVAGWEMYWRAYGVTPGYRNSDGQWLVQRRRIDAGEGGATVLVGASRILFDTSLPVWEKVAGKRPIQLALEGTSPVPIMENLADDPNFIGRLLVDVSPDIIFTGFKYRGSVIPYLRDQTPSQRIGDWLSMTFLEPYVAFYDPDYALSTVVRRQPFPVRTGMKPSRMVRKLAVQDLDRNTHMWDKVVHDPDYRALCRSIWAEDFNEPPPDMETPEKSQKVVDGEIARAVAAIDKMRARGVRVVFLRPPSDGEYYAYEQKYLKRADTWDLLLQRSGAPGIYFEDYPELQGYELPEWSHMSPPEAERFTANYIPIVERAFKALEEAPHRN
ncbi:MAG TPA: hypothetical protein VKB52_04140 [Rhodanobacteraceae bacterium]|nr:hypothetical protein [Rhodanobacteraceae bacterium]